MWRPGCVTDRGFWSGITIGQSVTRSACRGRTTRPTTRVRNAQGARSLVTSSAPAGGVPGLLARWIQPSTAGRRRTVAGSRPDPRDGVPMPDRCGRLVDVQHPTSLSTSATDSAYRAAALTSRSHGRSFHFPTPDHDRNRPEERARLMTSDLFHVYDTTLRDGAQQEGLNLSVADKLAIARQIDDLGVGFIEGGWPGANPKDTDFFRRAREELHLQHAQLAAFGATRRAGMKAADDPLIAALRDSGAGVVTLVAKSHDRHVELALRTTLEENLAMVQDTVSHLRAEGQRVFLDAEHFFDGYRDNRDYALEVLRTAFDCRRRGGRAVRHQRRHAARLGGRRRERRGRDDRRARRHPLPQRHRLRGREHAVRGRRRRHARPGHPQRVRRTHRQRRPRQRRRQPRAQARPPGAAERVCCARPPGSPMRSPRSPTSRRRHGSRTSASRRSRTRPGCTPARSRSTRTSTSTWIPRASATT